LSPARAGVHRHYRSDPPRNESLAERLDVAEQRAVLQRGVTFRYKDCRRNGRERFCTMTLAPDQFIRRLLLNVLPKGFHRIGHYGLLASCAFDAQVAETESSQTLR